MAPKSNGNRGIDPRLSAAIAACKVTATGLRLTGRGGTAAPGLVANQIDPRLLTKLSNRLEHGAIVVAGTNGKTTTSRMIADILAAAGRRVVHNRSGSNLARGISAAFAQHASIGGDPGGDIAVIETDEAAFPEVVRLTRPRIILLNNLFRDQLDRYGELNTIASKWRASLEQLGPETTVVVNADDPALAAITSGLRVRRRTFGLASCRYTLEGLQHAVDSATCRACGTDLAYDALYVSHLGAWRCPACGASRPPLDVAGSDVELVGVEALRLTVTPADAAPVRLDLRVPGLYNAYNALAAAAASLAAGIDATTIRDALGRFSSAFGRIERIGYRDRQLVLALVKNPVGFNEVLRMLTAADGVLTVPTLIAINDLFADGRDVSWLWDVDFELLADGEAPLFTTGLRGPDMANRLKYANVPVDRISALPEQFETALDRFVDAVPAGATAYILPTYTAMLEIRKILASRGAAGQFWEQ